MEFPLTQKRPFFGVTEGKLLGHIISKDGITIDPEWVKVISQLPFPHNKKTMQSFFGKINFVRKFIPYFTETIKPLQKMICKDVDFKWNREEKESFEKIKIVISQAPILHSPISTKIYFFILFPLISPWQLFLLKRMMIIMKLLFPS
jgi:hypothetical protein